MPRWTEEQQKAIDQEGTNIIVSAGAGSGKTAVLTARVLRKLTSGVDIDQLLILTFTNAAAKEMKDRIRKGIQKEESLKDQLDKIDNAYITTFDSYALSIVKKYHYLLPVSKNIGIGDASILNMEKKKILDEIFLSLYEKEDKEFLEMIQTFCVKDDDDIRKSILEMSKKLDLKYDKIDFLNHYLENYFQDSVISKRVEEYTSYLKSLIESVRVGLDNLSPFVDGDYLVNLSDSLTPLLESKTYDEIKNHLDIKLPSIPRGSDDEAKKIKGKISDDVKKLKEECIYESEGQIKEILFSTKNTVDVFIRILLELDRKYSLYKEKHELYEFIDISKMAIEIVEKNPSVRSELRDSYNEIMVDEYQDTNDLQEMFLSFIANNNIYMVGDIKQSIYRFRNANPAIFKDKYDHYSMHQGGEKIDLNKNFRSRGEVLSNINTIFDSIMDDAIGGARYRESHRMVFGNKTYDEEGKTKEDNNFEFIRYPYPKGTSYQKEEIEAFLIAQDIKKKVKTHYPIFDKDAQIVRNATYSDFVVLMDRAKNFDLYKQIFTYMQIPLSILRDEDLSKDYDFSILFHLIRLIVKTNQEDFALDFMYSFLAVFRSYLFKYPDDILFHVLKTNDFFSLKEMEQVKTLANQLEEETVTTFLDKIFEVFPFYERRIAVGGVNDAMKRFEFLHNMFEELEKIGYTVYDVDTYFSSILEQEEELKYEANKEEKDSAKIMTIHKSKGLEFPICYFAGLSSKFSMEELKSRYLFDETYGFIVPAFYEGILPTINKTLLRQKYGIDEISERIRLFYVALTRAKEKMIFILPEEEGMERENDMVDISIRSKYNSFLDVIKSIQEDIIAFAKNVSLEEIPLTKDYQVTGSGSMNLSRSKEEVWKTEELDTKEEVEDTKTLSKRVETLFTSDENKSRELGLLFHSYLEMVDLKNPDLDGIDEFYQAKIKHFLDLDLIQKKDYEFYQEYEFIDDDGKTKTHGIIDLLLEYPDHYIIIDYKLSSTKDMAYVKQLKGYQHYIEKKTGKKTSIYLYSILKEELVAIDE